MVSLVQRLGLKKDYVVQWHTQAGNIATDLKVGLDFTLPEISATNSVTWKFHADDSIKGRYDMILGRNILIELGLNLKLFDRIIEADDGYFKGSTAPMVDLGMD